MIDYLDVPIFKASVLFFIEESPEDIEQTLDGEANQGVLPVELCEEFVKHVKVADSYGVINPGVHGNMLLCLNKWNEDHLVHETGHLTFQILQRVGVPHTEDTDEVYQYVQEFLFSHIKELWHDFNKDK